jgi:hypothetical protein
MSNIDFLSIGPTPNAEASAQLGGDPNFAQRRAENAPSTVACLNGCFPFPMRSPCVWSSKPSHTTSARIAKCASSTTPTITRHARMRYARRARRRRTGMPAHRPNSPGTKRVLAIGALQLTANSRRTRSQRCTGNTRPRMTYRWATRHLANRQRRDHEGTSLGAWRRTRVTLEVALAA